MSSSSATDNIDIEKGPIDKDNDFGSEIITEFRTTIEDDDEMKTNHTDQSPASSSTSPSEPILLKVFEKGDPEDPHNWPVGRKIYQSLVLVSLCFTCAMSSSIFNPGLEEIEKKYDVTREVALLVTGMVLIGFVLGPIIWSPVNEAFGRKYAWSVAFFIFIIFQIPTGINPNFRTLLIGRFFQGFSGVSTLVSFGGSMSDIWDYKTRGFSAAAAVTAIFAAPALGPMIGAFLVEWANFGWLSWLVLIMGGVLFILNLFVKETFAPVLLRQKAIRLRKEGQNVRALLEDTPPTLRNMVTKYCIRPFAMIFEDRALLFLCTYSSISYGLLYSILVALPLTLSETHHFAFVPTYIPSLSVLIGVLGTAALLCYTNAAYVRSCETTGVYFHPDHRLINMMFTAISLPIGLFIFAWTAAYPQVHWIAPVIGAAIVGFSTSTIFISAIMYMIESYGPYGSSAFAINAIYRSIIAVLFLLTLGRMIDRMHIEGAFSFFGGLAILIAPGPFILYKNGKKWRAASKWCNW